MLDLFCSKRTAPTSMRGCGVTAALLAFNQPGEGSNPSGPILK